MSELKKKPSLLYVLQILQKYSHEGNPLTQNKIAEYLLDEYDIELERKAISRCIDVLEMADYDIVRTREGVYLGSVSELEDAQLQIIIDSVAGNRTISAADSKNLIDQLMAMGTAGLKARNQHINTLNAWGKPEKSSTHYNIDAIQQAIQEKHQISFFYDDYTFHLHDPHAGLYEDTLQRITASPVQIVPRGGYEYLIAVVRWKPCDKLQNVIEAYRLDLLRDVKIGTERSVRPEEVPGYEKGWNVKDFLSANPYMTPNGKVCRCKFAFCNCDIPLIRELFGNNAFIQAVNPVSKNIDNPFRAMFATVDINSGEALRIARRYNMELELVHPPRLRQIVTSQLKKAVRKYEEPVKY